ncbi:hypothetical protein HMPREF0731_1380, partial [Pseudoroseomonas cervicalis ATCC 49957]
MAVRERGRLGGPWRMVPPGHSNATRTDGWPRAPARPRQPHAPERDPCSDCCARPGCVSSLAFTEDGAHGAVRCRRPAAPGMARPRAQGFGPGPGDAGGDSRRRAGAA